MQRREPAVIDRIRELVAESAAGAIEAHDLRTRHAGKVTFLEFHLVVPGTMTVAESHAICDRIEETLKAEMEQSGDHHPCRAGSRRRSSRVCRCCESREQGEFTARSAEQGPRPCAPSA